MAKDRAGFTLIEILVAGLIISVAMMGLASVFVMSTRRVSVNSNKNAALYYSQETLRMLSNYVADEPIYPAGTAENVAGWFDATTSGRRPDWQSCTPVSCDAAVPPNCWGAPGGDCDALAAGTHYRTQVSLGGAGGDFANGTILGKVRYTVTNGPVGGAPAGWKQVQVTANWAEP